MKPNVDLDWTWFFSKRSLRGTVAWDTIFHETPRKIRGFDHHKCRNWEIMAGRGDRSSWRR